nr:hypothetical protein CFP56_45802 [Quercus suber]
MSEQIQGVTAGREECIDTEINSLLMRNKGDKNIKEDTAVQGRMNGDFMKAVKVPYVTVADVEPNIEELSLAKEFGAATIRGLDKKGSKNPSSRATLSHSSQLKQARDPQEARVIHMGASTWKRRERRNTGDKTESSSFGIRADFRSIQHNRRQPLESQTVKRANQPRMTLPFKYLPHEILNKPKPAPAIRIYPAASHEFFIPKSTEKPMTPPKLVTTIRARL